MLNEKLLNPRSIVVVGGSDDTGKPGGAVLRNLIESNFKGKIFVVNPKADTVQGIKSYNTVSDLPQVDCAIIAIAAKYCVEAVEILTQKKETQGFIILSAGFSEENSAGAELETKIVKMIDDVKGSLIGPNCTGLLTINYNGAFTKPVPKLDPKGVDFVSGSGATAIFIVDNGIRKGIKFSNVFAVGNSAQVGVEEVLEHFDQTFDYEKSPRIKLLYVESISKPDKFLKHASSLISKGCRIAAIKSGSSTAGSRAASSHTGALASPDVAVEALFRKVGIVRCSGRDELMTVAAIFDYPELKGKNIAIVTHAGGPAVMLTDALSNGNLEIPHLEGTKAEKLLANLFGGSSVSNPIDFLATGTAEQLGLIIDTCNNDFDEIDGIAVIFGSPGLSPVYEPYRVVAEKLKTTKKPIFPIFPSYEIVQDEINEFLLSGKPYFSDEVLFGNALAKVYNTPKSLYNPAETVKIEKEKIRNIINNCNENGYIEPDIVQQLLDAAGIERAGESVVTNRDDAAKKAVELGLPVVMKVIGPVHKSDVGGVVLNVKDVETVKTEFDRMIKIKDTTAILIQPMLSGTELFIGAKRDEKFGHIILCGMGGIFIEVLKDIQSELVPVSQKEAEAMITRLRSNKIFKGIRGQEAINEIKFAEIITRVSALCASAPEIFEMDLNPLLAKGNRIIAVDARVRIEK
jgi:acetyltransferase